MFFHTTEMNIQLMEVLQKCSKGGAFSHLGKSIYILGEALAAITELTIGAWYIGMSIVDIA